MMVNASLLLSVMPLFKNEVVSSGITVPLFGVYWMVILVGIEVSGWSVVAVPVAGAGRAAFLRNLSPSEVRSVAITGYD